MKGNKKIDVNIYKVAIFTDYDGQNKYFGMKNGVKDTKGYSSLRALLTNHTKYGRNLTEIMQFSTIKK